MLTGANGYDQKILSFLGETAAGDWNLIIADFEAENGTLIKWLIEIKYCGDGEVTWPEECELGGNNCTTQCKCEQGTRPDPNTLGACIANSKYHSSSMSRVYSHVLDRVW